LALNLRLIGGSEFESALRAEGANEFGRRSDQERCLRSSREPDWIAINNGNFDKPKQYPIKYALQFRSSSDALPITVYNNVITGRDNCLSDQIMAVTNVDNSSASIILKGLKWWGRNSIFLRDKGSCDPGDDADLLAEVLYFDLEMGMSGFKNESTIQRNQQDRPFDRYQGSFGNVQLALHDIQLAPENHSGYEAYHGESGRKNSD
jgi:hypothetical protein